SSSSELLHQASSPSPRPVLVVPTPEQLGKHQIGHHHVGAALLHHAQAHNCPEEPPQHIRTSVFSRWHPGTDQFPVGPHEIRNLRTEWYALGRQLLNLTCQGRLLCDASK